MSIKTKPALAIAVAALVFLGGCSMPLHKSVNTKIEDRTEAARASISAHRTQSDGIYRTMDQPFVVGAPVEREPESSATPQLSMQVSYGHDWSTLDDAAGYLSEAAGIPIRLSADTYAAAQAEGIASVSRATAPFEFASMTAPLKDVLDRLTARTGTLWKEGGGGVVISYLDTRTFSLEVMPGSIQNTGTITNASGVGESSSGGGSGGSDGVASLESKTTNQNQQTTSVEYTSDFAKDLKEILGAMLSPDGKVAVSGTPPSVTVRDNAAVLDLVEAFITDINFRLSRQVEIEMTVLTIDISDSDSFGLDWNLIKAGVGDATVEALSIGNAGADGSSLTATIVDPTNRWAGSSAIVNALRESVNATVQRVTTVHAMNSQPVRLQTTLQNGYVQSISTSLVSNVGAQTDFQTGYLTTGFSLTLLPLILDDSQVVLQVQGAISAPQGMRKVSVGEDLQIEIPDSSNDDFFQRAKLRNGSTLVLTSLDQEALGSTGSGVGSAKNQLLGGRRNVSDTRRMMVILLSPRVTG